MGANKAVKDLNTEQRILDAAKNVFLKNGMVGARMQEIADEAGINKALLHYYFRNKEQLFDRIFMDAAGQLFPKVREVLESDASLFEMIEQFCDDYISIIASSPYLPMFMLTEINRDPQAFMNKIHKMVGFPDPKFFLRRVEKEIRKGTIIRIDPVQLLLNVLSMCLFPFVARPMIQVNLHLDEKQFQSIMEQRRKEVPKFILAAIRK